jgi:hypothetical protein
LRGAATLGNPELLDGFVRSANWLVLGLLFGTSAVANSSEIISLVYFGFTRESARE